MSAKLPCCAAAALLMSIVPVCGKEPLSEVRAWTTSNGQKFNAKLMSADGANGIFLFGDGQATKIALQHLSPADQKLIRLASGKGSPSGGNPPATIKPAVLAKPRAWPPVVEVPPNSIEITIAEQDAKKRRYVYKSQSFEFVSQDKLATSVMREVARTFEATRALVSSLPWGVDPRPPKDLGFYQARLFATREDYFADGGPVNSGGVYFSKDRIFRIPFQSLGLAIRGKTWFKKADYRGDTLVHEVTHQMMHDYLPFLPSWVSEGTAEYTQSLPYNAGRFIAASHARGLKDYLAKCMTGKSPGAGFRPFIRHMKTTRDEWDQLSQNPDSQRLLYCQSYLLVYYFCHLDGDGKGTRFLKYMDSVAEAARAWEDFFKRPEVKVHADGSFSWPGGISPPVYPRSEQYGVEKSSILLDGRNESAMEADIQSGFRKLGIRLQVN